MNEPFVYSLTLDMCAVDFTGHWQPGAAIRATQEAANAHCDLLNLPYDALRKRGIAWVLTRTHIQMDEYPTLGQTVRVRTWPGVTRHMFFPRNFIFEVNGRELGRAVSIFVLLDLETRKIALPSRLGSELPLYDLPAPLPFPGNVAKLSTEPAQYSYAPVYTDFDVNGHVNNTRYLDWFCNQFPYERHAREELCDLLIHYHFEVLPQETLRFELREEQHVSVLAGLNGEQTCFAVQGTWRARACAAESTDV
ncbi:MAG: thioesterase [Clostridia bacterium]